MQTKHAFQSNSATYKNTYYPDKPNEDYIIADDTNGIYILLDGVSVDRVNGKYPCPSPALEASRIFATSVYKNLCINIYDNDSFQSIKLAIEEANNELKKLAIVAFIVDKF